MNNSKQLLKALHTFLAEDFLLEPSWYEISSIKKNGTVCVKLRSTTFVSASELADRVCLAFENSKCYSYERRGIDKIDVPLEQFQKML